MRGKGKRDGEWIFDMKEEDPRASFARLVARTSKESKLTGAARVEAGLRACIADVPRALGTTKLRGFPMLVRRLTPQEDRLDLHTFPSRELDALAHLLGALVGRAHVRGATQPPKRSWTAARSQPHHRLGVAARRNARGDVPRVLSPRAFGEAAMSDVEEARRFFDAIAPRYDRIFARPREEMRPRMDRLLALLGPPRDVLDLGVGTGRELSALLDAGHRVVGVDVSESMIALCNQRARPIRCVHADFWSGLPFGDASFDAVIALFGTLAHAPVVGSAAGGTTRSPEVGSAAGGTTRSLEVGPAHADLAREIARVLRPGGAFVAEVPTPAWAAAHPTFEDEASGARIDVVAPSPDAWREAFAAFEVEIAETADELAIVGRLRAERA